MIYEDETLDINVLKYCNSIFISISYFQMQNSKLNYDKA